jgi:hypothetical protein
VYLEEDEWLSDSQMSASSVIHKPKHQQKKSAKIDETVSILPFPLPRPEIQHCFLACR